jgi:hypothetical protein
MSGLKEVASRVVERIRAAISEAEAEGREATFAVGIELVMAVGRRE